MQAVANVLQALTRQVVLMIYIYRAHVPFVYAHMRFENMLQSITTEREII